MPFQGSVAQMAAQALTNVALAQRISMIYYSRRSFSKEETDAYLAEASKRLRWVNVYQAHRSE